MMHSNNKSPEVYFDCNSEVRYCAIASPRGPGHGEVFRDLKSAQNKWKEVKGSRMKFFDNWELAKTFANTPISCSAYTDIYPPSPKADVESTPFSNVSQSILLKLRKLIENDDLDKVRDIVEDNPLSLVTSSDTPTLLQIRLRYNALHVAAASGSANTIKFILNVLGSLAFWKRIYPGSELADTHNRRLHVLDLYLNSPELGNLETPLHFASKFGHVNCVRLLVIHPMTQLSSVNRSGQTASDIAATRITRKCSSSTDENVPDAIHRALGEHYVILGDVTEENSEPRVCVLPPLTAHRSQVLLASILQQSLPGLLSFLPFLDVEVENQSSSLSEDRSSAPRNIDLREYGYHGYLQSIRAIAGPLPLLEAESFRTKWLRANSKLCHCKEFASIRLTDFAKGYERQGRFFSRLFHTQWYEFWDFLGDFVDLSSASGLAQLDNHLQSGNLCLPSTNDHMLDEAFTSDLPNHQRACSSLQRDLFSADDALHSTPIVKHKSANRITLSASSNGANDVWNRYREQPDAISVLSDSLDGSSDSSPSDEIRGSSLQSDVCSPEGSQKSSLLSPLVGLLSSLTFSSPLRWMFMDGPTQCEPIFDPELSLPAHKRPVKIRISLPPALSPSSPGKRRHSKLDRHSLPPASRDQPLSKKAPSKRSFKIPPLFRQILHALPGGDPELDIAGAMLTREDKEMGPSMSSSPYCRSLSLDKFPTVAAWKRQLDSALNLLNTQNSD